MTRGKAYFMGGPLDGQFRDMPDVYHIVYPDMPVQPTLFDDPDAERITYTAVGYGVVGPGIEVTYMRYDEGDE